MSISIVATTLLAAASPTPATSPTAGEAELNGIIMSALYAWTIIAIILAVRLRVFRPETVVGPKRLADVGGTRGLLVSLVLGLSVWLFGQGIYLGFKQAQWAQQGITVPKDVTEALSPADFAILSTVPPALGFLVLLGAALFIGEGWLDRLGVGIRKVGRGIGQGIVGFIIVGPAVFWTLALLGRIYQRIHYEHPTEHVLLKSLGEAEGPAAAIFIAIGVSICAPLFEEFLFRGHVQTLIRQLAMLMSAKRELVSPPEAAFPPGATGTATAAALPGGPDVAATPVLPSIPLAYQRVAPLTRLILTPAPWHGWVAILITSLVFAMFHPMWMWPPIFVLSLGLGYVYERTGNLWAAITIHCLFNSLETVQYLTLMRGH